MLARSVRANLHVRVVECSENASGKTRRPPRCRHHHGGMCRHGGGSASTCQHHHDMHHPERQLSFPREAIGPVVRSATSTTTHEGSIADGAGLWPGGGLPGPGSMG
jgi:hypothetical protein